MDNKERFKCIDCKHCIEVKQGYICDAANSRDNKIDGVSLYTARYCGDGEKK